MCLFDLRQIYHYYSYYSIYIFILMVYCYLTNNPICRNFPLFIIKLRDISIEPCSTSNGPRIATLGGALNH